MDSPPPEIGFIWDNGSTRQRLELNFRLLEVSEQLMPGVGTLTMSAGAEIIGSSPVWELQLCSEKWLFPVIQPGPERNISAPVEFQFQRRRLFRPSLPHASQSATGGADQP
jgi:hypothetical protein